MADADSDTRPLPKGWQRHFDPNYQRHYFVDPDGASTWYDPRPPLSEVSSAAPAGPSSSSKAAAAAGYASETVHRPAGDALPAYDHSSTPANMPSSDAKKLRNGAASPDYHVGAFYPGGSSADAVAGPSDPAYYTAHSAAAGSASPTPRPLSPTDSRTQLAASASSGSGGGASGNSANKAYTPAQYQALRQDEEDPIYAAPRVVVPGSAAAAAMPAPPVKDPYMAATGSDGYVYQAAPTPQRRYCCGCFRTRRGCCTFWGFFIFLILCALGVVVYFLFPRIPSVTVGSPVASTSTDVITTTGSLSSASSSSPYTISFNLQSSITVKSDNYEDIAVSSVVFSGSLLDFSGSTLSDSTLNGTSSNVVIKGKSTTNFTMPFSMVHKVTTSGDLATVVESDDTLFVLYTACSSSSTKKLQISYTVTVTIDAISWTGYKPSTSGTASFACPVSALSSYISML
ncbi:hypothetical protein HK405_004679 [Cladochytrium tenue]|nr:hypothetical protein HK405_004679 [Cladochytrium tenue]